MECFDLGGPRRAVLTTLAALLGSACIFIPIEVETEPTRPEQVAAAGAFALVPPPWPHPELGPRLEEEIRTTLAAKGLREVPLEQADIAVNYRASREKKVRVRNEPDPDTQGYRVREQYIEKTVEIDVFSAGSETLLWRGIGRVGVVSEGSLPSVATRAVRAILAKLPVHGQPPDQE